jgi:hypothetical protein
MLLLQLLIAQGRHAEARESFALAEILFQSPRFAQIRQMLAQLKKMLPQPELQSRPLSGGNQGRTWGGGQSRARGQGQADSNLDSNRPESDK